MILKLLRFENEVQIGTGHIATLQIENRTVFARAVASLLSGQGEQAVEPYAIWDDGGKKRSARNFFLILSSLPDLPLKDRTLLGKFYAKVGLAVSDDIELETEVLGTANTLKNQILGMNVELWGKYDFAAQWDMAQILKAFSFVPDADDEQPLIDRMVGFFGLLADIDMEKPLLMVNAKSFFSPEDLDELASQAFFYGVKVLMLESWPDETEHAWERKTCIDRQLLEK